MGHEIIHFEIPARNLAKLGRFYSSVFGWKITDSGMKGMKYMLVKTGSRKGALGGGMYKRVKKEGPRNFVGTNNIDATIKKFKKAGGKIIMGKADIPNVGFSAIGLDPEGNTVGLFQPRRSRGR
ncbi:MAG: VOC family protein [Candidatus Micrarchaeota archaeon]|nr:VOC family protein [Candidatus Micrarchaeota archaeon]